MPENRGVVGQIVAAVIVALLVGGTAPWWWREVFPTRPVNPVPSPVVPQPNATQPNPANAGDSQPPGPLESPESLSRTADSLTGDAIIHFRVLQIEARDLLIEVDYRFNSLHGEKVYAGARLNGGVSSGYFPAVAPTPREGTVKVKLSANEAGSSDAIDIFLYESGRPAEPFARRTFVYRMRFE